MINYEDFAKLELKIAKILSAERIEGTDKLLRLGIDLGAETRQLVAGIAESYQPEELVGQEIVVVANLEPRLIKGVESQGMLLAASDDPPAGGGPVILIPEKEVPPGAEVK